MAHCRVVRQRGFDGFSYFLRSFADAGFMRLPQTLGEESRLVQACWIVSDFFLPFLESDSVGDTADLPALEARHQEQGASLLRLVLRPYLITDGINNAER